MLEAWFAGQEQGDAIARVLFGDVNPSGKLPAHLPRRRGPHAGGDPEQYPGVDGTVHYREGVFVGYRGYDELGIEPRFPFGHGQSYTDFAYADLDLRPLPLDDRWRPTPSSVSFDLENIGPRPGTEIAQVYVGPLPADVASPPRRLAGWARADLAVGERRRVTVAIDRRSLGLVGRAHRCLGSASRAAPSRSRSGASSRDIRLRGQVTVPG